MIGSRSRSRRGGAPDGGCQLPRYPGPGPAARIAIVLLALGSAPPLLAASDTPAAPRGIVLSFDAAWSSSGADEILDVLAARGVKATFFLAGRFIREQPEIARRIAAEGHEAGNHTFHHEHLTRYAIDGTRGTLAGIDAARLRSELEATRSAWEAATGTPLAPIWRAPYGEINDDILSWARDAGYVHIGWSEGLDAHDWVRDPASHLYRSPATEVRRLLARLTERTAADGPAILLLHLGSERAAEERFGRVLGDLIDGSRALGYRFLTAGEALREGPMP